MRTSRHAAAVPMLALSTLPLALAAPAAAHEGGGGSHGVAVSNDARHDGRRATRRGDDHDDMTSRTRVDRYLGPLHDLQPDGADVTDNAAAGAFVMSSWRGTFVWFGLAALDQAAVGQTYGAHVHTGPCVAGDPDAAGPHLTAGPSPSPETEVWLDVAVQDGRWGIATAAVPFMIPVGGAGSIVVHAQPTDPATGEAGDRLACIPLDGL